MPRLIIDDLEVDVPKGTKVIEAAERLGIIIPRFCYHKALGAVGACRMCAVKFLEGQFKGVQMSCMIDAQDGMVVSTTDEEAVDFRRHVIEWLMMNHPHDCPVCDEGGHCLLQDMTVSGGHGIRRFLGNKRTYRDQYLGELVQHEMNRCIHCYRCVRFYQEYAGYRDLGTMQIANKVFYGRFRDGALESPFSGNLIDICPTGVYTDKPTRYRVRRWDLQRTPSLCIHCSLGCNTVGGARYREMLRQEARFNEAVNGYFICDRGRYGFAYAGHRQRPRTPRTGSKEVGLADALRFAAERLASYDAGQVACLGSTRSSVETQAVLEHLCRLWSWARPAYFFDPALQRKVSAAISRLSGSTALSLREMEAMDCIVAVGVDPVNEAPMLALAMRQASRNGAVVVVIDPRPISLPFDFEHLAVPLNGMDACLAALLKGAVSEDDAARIAPAAQAMDEAMPSSCSAGLEVQDANSRIASKVRSSGRLALVCGTDIVPESTPSRVADALSLLGAAKERAGLFYVLPGANCFGAALLSASAPRSSFAEVLGGIEEGKIRALIVVESDPFMHFYDRRRLEKAIEKLGLLIVLDYLPSETVNRADIFLPTRTLFETESSYINQEGRLQHVAPVHRVGTPIWQVSGGSHPPRRYGLPVIGGEPEAAWRVLADLARSLSPHDEAPCSEGPWKIVAEQYPATSAWQTTSGVPAEKRILPEQGELGPFASSTFPGDQKDSSGDLDLLLVDWTFGTEELSNHSPIVQKVEGVPTLSMHEKDAAKLGISDGDFVSLDVGNGSFRVAVKTCPDMAAGTLVLPRHHRLDWQKLSGFQNRLTFGNITKGDGAKRLG